MKLQSVVFEVDTERQRLRALSHPVRLRILSLLTDSPKSGTELAPLLSMSQAAVSYHVRALADAGLIELDEVRPVRGGREKLYRLVDGGKVTGAPSDLEANVVTAAAEIVRRIEALGPRSWDVFGDLEVWVEEETWVRHTQAIATEIEHLHAVAKPRREPGTIRVSSTTLMFSENKPKPARRRRKGNA